MIPTDSLACAVAAGLALIPWNDHQPLCGYSQLIDPDPEYKYNFNNFKKQFEFATRVAAMCGKISGNIEAIDIDVDHNPRVLQELDQVLKKESLDFLFKKLVVTRTKSGGVHLIYRVDNPSPPEVLAYTPKDGKRLTLIERKGEGSMIFIPPTPGYKVIQNNLFDPPLITPDEQKAIINVCRQINFIPDRKTYGDSTFQDSKADTYRKIINNIITQLDQRSIDITFHYEDWIKLGLGIANSFGEEGREYFHKISCHYPDYKYELTDHKYNDFLKTRKRNAKASVLSLFAIAKSYDIKITEKDITSLPLDVDFSPVESWIIKQRLVFNEITSRIETDAGTILDDYHLNSLWLNCRKQTGLKVGKGLFEANLFNYDNLISYNPLHSYFTYLSSIPRQAGVVDLFLSHLDIHKPEMMLYIKKWLVSVVASVYGHTSELILVLTGPQHNGKTEFFIRLLPKRIRNYFATDKLDQGKDSDILMTQKLIILDDEFSGKSKKDSRHLKALASKQSFSIRLPYAKIPRDLNRLAVLCGTSNHTDVINDNTGNRRIIPISLRQRNYSISDNIDREKLWAGLLDLYLQGEDQYRLTAQEVAELKQASTDYTSVNVERELIEKYYSVVEPNDQYSFFTTTEICSFLRDKHPGITIWPAKVGQELHELGFLKAQERLNGNPSPVKGWRVHKKGTTNTIPADIF